jgi:pimeloyl-ACP methyl ester carboxylesterase/predicted glycosyltransferase
MPQTITGTAAEQSRARYPDAEGFVERDGVRIFWESYGSGQKAILLLPSWMIIHARTWKAQIPYLARHFRVLTFDPRGNGHSDRPTDPALYGPDQVAHDALAVLDAAGLERAVVVGFSAGVGPALILGGEHPERVAGLVFIGTSLPVSPSSTARAPALARFWDEVSEHEGWSKYNASYWRSDYPDFLTFFFSEVFSEPHSTKQIEDCVGWGLETSGETLVTDARADSLTTERTLELATRVTCPVLAIHGTEDRISPLRRSEVITAATGGVLVPLEGSGHAPHGRDPVKVNRLIRDFVEPPPPTFPWVRGRSRRRRALFISSPIGLGHAQRDVAIARELRVLHPELEIDWLAQHPVTRVLEANGERVHRQSALLASESAHIESESAEHRLNCFAAWRRMDEVLVSNFMVFHDLVRDEQYDLWIGDESWELDYYLHENPELKTSAYAWLTDFVGWLPMPDGGERERFLTADYNAEMIEHIARYPRIRDRAIFVGNPDDIVPDTFGDGLPEIRRWTEEHYSFSGYITGFDNDELADRAALRAQLGYSDDERVCLVAVGGTSVGVDLLRRVIEAFPAAKERINELRMIVVAGPRIERSQLPAAAGVEIATFVPNLYRHFAACDLAVVQAGLTTSMELVANDRPFIYFPLRDHFEQNYHVRHRLDRYRAGRHMEYGSATPDMIGQAIAEEINRRTDYRPVERDGAARAARMIAELL